MTRRLTLATLLTVLISVLLAGIGTLLFTRAEDQRATQRDLEATADALTFIFTEIPIIDPNNSETIRQQLRRIQQELRLADAELLILNRNGTILGEIPAVLEGTPVDVDTLESEGQVSGIDGPIVYAAAYGSRRTFDFIIILTADSSRLTIPVLRWVLWSGFAAVLAGALIAWLLGRRIARPLQAASAASRRIAAGDLSARVDTDSESNDELSELGNAINHMAKSLDRARGLERQFLLSVSHDLRTPLTSIRGYAEAIADGTAVDGVRAATIIQTEAQRLERLVTDLLDLAKLDARQFNLVLQPTDLSQLVPDVAAGFQRQASEVGVRILVDGSDQALWATVDPDRLAQILANLIENALKFAEATIIVTYSTSAGRPQLVVADDGPGISTEDMPNVFDRLYVTGQAPKRRETGSGLGLAIVKELVEAHGGRVTALPRPTGGTQFVVDLS